jgi:hypothetical protein
MAKHYRKMVVHGDHLEASKDGPPWTVLWDTVERGDQSWSTVRTQSEASALERAAHFVKLGFVVHAIKDPSGAVIMDAAAIAGRFGRAEEMPQPRVPERAVPSTEQSARDILRGFVEDHQATPGRMLAASTLHALLSPHGVSLSEFQRAVTFAKDHGWLGVGDGVLTLTQAGYAAVTG